jgi:GNAT superfamily N-acetyltransferase
MIVTGGSIAPTPITLRPATGDDVAEMARIRELGGWTGGAGAERMALYLAGAHHPRYALQARIVLVAEDGISIVGYIAGHLTTRFGCDGELQWLFVLPAYRGGGVASRLLGALATWCARHDSRSVCVDVEPENARARRFYLRHGARALDTHWLVWDDISQLAEPSPSGS